MEAIKNFCYVKGEGAVNHSLVTKCLKKFCLGCKKLDDQARSSWPKAIDSKAVLQAIEATPASSTQEVSSKLGISQSSVVGHFHNLSKSIQNYWIMPLPKYCKTFDSPK